MSNLDIAQFIGSPNAIIQRFGLEIYEEATRIVGAEGSVLLDFSGLKNTTSGFFHASIGNLYKKYGDRFSDFVKLNGLEKPDWKEKFQDAVDLASNPKKASDIDKAISELFES